MVDETSTHNIYGKEKKMTDEKMLREIIKNNGLKLQFVAEKVGLSYQGFLNKLRGTSDFNVSEIQGLCELLNINKRDRDRIFFAN